MHELYELKDKLCDELLEYGRRDVSAGTLEVLDKLTHTIKNLDKIIKSKEDEEYSGTYYNDGMPVRRSYMVGGSYARGRGRNARRDSMGRYASEDGYSRNAEMVNGLYNLMGDAPDEMTRKEIEKLAKKIEAM